MKKRCILFTSKDTDSLHEFAVERISRDFDLQKTWRLNRRSPNIDSLRCEIEEFENIDYVFNFLSPKLFPAWLIDFPKIGCINFHPASFEYPGVGSASYSLYDKRENYGVTAHFMTKDIDRGEIIAERFFKQYEFKNCKELFHRALQECCVLLEDTLILLKNQSRPSGINSWKRPAITRREFAEWMTMDLDTPKDEILKKVAATRHPDFPGPYIKVDDLVFSYIYTPKAT